MLFIRRGRNGAILISLEMHEYSNKEEGNTSALINILWISFSMRHRISGTPPHPHQDFMILRIVPLITSDGYDPSPPPAPGHTLLPTWWMSMLTIQFSCSWYLPIDLGPCRMSNSFIMPFAMPTPITFSPKNDEAAA